ncbi:hypothetical protein D9M72_525690 [compost metagenome]
MRADTVADGEQEDQEQGGLQITGNLDAQLPDEDARQQRGGDVSEIEPRDLDGSDQETDAEGEEDSDRRIGPKRLDEEVNWIHCHPL